MADKNITKVYLLDVPLENNYKNTLYFTSKAAQQEYFASKVVKSYAYTDFHYQRKDHIIRIGDNIDNLYNCNYVMYQNSAYSNKWFYAFIKDMKYINDGTTEVQIETDCLQTWLFDYTVKPSFVEREHVADDTLGLHTIPEGLETGDYIDQLPEIGEEYSFNDFLDETYIVLGVSEIGLDTTVPNGVKSYNGVYSGLYYLVFNDGSQVEKYIDKVQEKISEDNIYTAFMIPKVLYDRSLRNVSDEYLDHFTFKTIDGCNFAFFPYVDGAFELSAPEITKTDYLDSDYKPRNNKLLCYPYKYFAVSNNAGSANTYKYEEFERSECTFSLKGVISPGCSIKLVPTDYKVGKTGWNTTKNDYSEGLDCGKLPTCGWNNDSYTNWLTQNAINIPLGIAGGVGSLVGGVAMLATGAGALAGAGMVAGGVMSIFNQISQRYERSTIPETAKGGVNQGDFNFSKKLAFTIYKKSIKEEYAKTIDDFFDMFGYQINKVKVPNKAHRSRWWYTKTQGVNIVGSIPMNDLNIIKKAYDEGITFWRNASEIHNYELTNETV